MKSKLEPYIDLLVQWVGEGLNNQEIVTSLKEAGLTVNEATVRRFLASKGIKREKIDDSSVLARAKRSSEGIRTIEDKLRDEIDDLSDRLKDAEQIIKRSRERELIDDRIADMIDSVFETKGAELTRPVLRTPQFNGDKSKPHEFVLMLSDAHYGEVVNPDEALGLNYDTNICKKRIEEIRDVVFRYAELKQEAYPIQKLTIACLGDMVSGVIHEELEASNQVRMVEQAVEMGHILFDFLSDTAQVFPEVEMIVKVGNHPRIHKKPRYKGKFDNWEYMMGHMIAGMAKYALPEVSVVVPKDLVYVHEVFDYRIGMVHGDGVKSNSFAGIPFYGLRNQREAVQALMSQTGQTRIDMFMMGHFHQYVFWGGECDIIINGSIKGGDEFGIGTRLSAPDPEQILLEWHPKHGLTSKTVIKLGHIK